MTTPKPKRGRPPGPPRRKVQLSLAPELHAELERLAEADHLAPATWAAQAVAREVERRQVPPPSSRSQ